MAQHFMGGSRVSLFISTFSRVTRGSRQRRRQGSSSRSSSMGLANQNVAIVNAVELGNNGPTLELNNRPTLIVSRSTAEPAAKSISLAGIQAVNFIAGVNALLQSATLQTNAVYLFVNSQPGVVTLRLDNGGTIAGQSTPYVLAFGAPIHFQFDGTNLN